MSASPWTLRISQTMMRQLTHHLFPGDGDEHGAVIAASVVTTRRGTRLLASELYLARDGVDYVKGQRGYRMLTAAFVRDCALDCADKELAYLAVHCHGGTDQVGFSDDDFASHARGYPALLDILDGQPVGGLVFAKHAVAGDIWLPGGKRIELDHLEVVGRPLTRLYTEPSVPPLMEAEERYDRQVRLLGDRGQKLLEQQKVAVIGAGGAGSLIIEYLARLGVKNILVIDPDRIELSNLPRVVGSTRRDARPILTSPKLPAWLRRWTKRLRTAKVRIARRVARQANPAIALDAVADDVLHGEVAELLIDCDYIFLAADPMQVRLLFNALVHQYLIPGVQVGAKAQLDHASGEILDLFSIVRPMIPGEGCLWCNGLILPSKLQEEAISPEERARQRYVDDEDVAAPSVITLNAVAAADAVNDYLMVTTGLLADESALRWSRYEPRDRDVIKERPRQDDDCPECSSPQGRLGKGPRRRLPIR